VPRLSPASTSLTRSFRTSTTSSARRPPRSSAASYHCEREACHAAEGFLIAEKRALWWDSKAEANDSGSGSYVELSERFFVEATEAPVPLDIRVLRALRSPFEIDLYVWLTWRFFRLRRPVTIPWESLLEPTALPQAAPRLPPQRPALLPRSAPGVPAGGTPTETVADARPTAHLTDESATPGRHCKLGRREEHEPVPATWRLCALT
jgi:hypothetical protein